MSAKAMLLRSMRVCALEFIRFIRTEEHNGNGKRKRKRVFFAFIWGLPEVVLLAFLFVLVHWSSRLGWFHGRPWACCVPNKWSQA